MAGARAITDLDEADPLNGTEMVEISQLSEAVKISAATISADGDDQSFNDSADGFVSAGFTVGMRVNVSGFDEVETNNLFVGTITALTAGKMTIGGTDGEGIGDEAAGDTVTIAKWNSRRVALPDGGGGSATAAVITKTGTSADLDPADVTKYQRWTNSATKTLTVRDEADVALPANGEWHIYNAGAGALTLVEDTSVTINPPPGGTLSIPEGGACTLKRAAADLFDLIGNTVAA
jgi:hypothetical protein